MSDKSTGIVCVGCDRDSSVILEYDDENRVQDDGTFYDEKFVCTKCYMKLIDQGMDVGEPRILQCRMLRMKEAGVIK